MEINWVLITYVVLGYFALAGFSRGWWKEAITTIILALLIFFLQNPDWAQSFVAVVNDIIAAVWSILPSTLTSTVNSGLETAFAANLGSSTPQIDATRPDTWVILLAILVGGAILFGRLNFGHQPTGLGKLFGAFIGGLNGFLILNIVREYLDGRALPGQSVATSSNITLVGSSSFGPAARDLAIRTTDLPSYTILDSVIPWVAIGVGLVFLFSVFKTRVGIDTNQDGRKIATRVPPFYKKPPPKEKKEKTLVDIFGSLG